MLSAPPLPPVVPPPFAPPPFPMYAIYSSMAQPTVFTAQHDLTHIVAVQGPPRRAIPLPPWHGPTAPSNECPWHAARLPTQAAASPWLAGSAPTRHATSARVIWSPSCAPALQCAPCRGLVLEEGSALDVGRHVCTSAWSSASAAAAVPNSGWQIITRAGGTCRATAAAGIPYRELARAGGACIPTW